MKKLLIIVLAASIFILGACASKTENKSDQVASPSVVETEAMPAILSVANPASVNCITLKGTSKIVTKEDGSQYGVCYFEDNRQCEEWALMRGDCPLSGRKVTGHITEPERYCAITGGDVNENKKTCTFKEQVCDLQKYYDGNGTCVE